MNAQFWLFDKNSLRCMRMIRQRYEEYEVPQSNRKCLAGQLKSIVQDDTEVPRLRIGSVNHNILKSRNKVAQSCHNAIESLSVLAKHKVEHGCKIFTMWPK